MSEKPTELPTNETVESSDNLVTWIGLHGTCISHGEIILKEQGFRRPKLPGMAGTGIYFWIGEYSRQLASEWHAKRQGDFKYELKPGCCILTCEITCDVNNTFHLADPLFISTIEKLVAHAKSGGRKFLSEEIM